MKAKKLAPFRLRDAVTDPLYYLLFTTLPTESFINRLWKIVDTVGNQINECINEAYYLVTQRNGSGEGKSYYFPHIAATALYEASAGKKIKDKGHGIKTGMFFNKLIGTLKKVREALKNKKLTEEKRQILEEGKSELIGQINATLFALKKLSPETQDHLLKHQNLNVEKRKFRKMRERHQKRIEQIHPTPVDETPKKASTPAKRSRNAIVANAPPEESAIGKKAIARRLF